MGFGDKCCVGGCNNDRRYPKEWVIHSHVEKLSFHKPKQSLIEAWPRQVQKGTKDFSIGKSRESVVACSNHFRDRKPSVSNPIPSLFLIPFEHSNSKSPKSCNQVRFCLTPKQYGRYKPWKDLINIIFSFYVGLVLLGISMIFPYYLKIKYLVPW